MDNFGSENQPIQIDGHGKSILTDMAGWTTFIGIVMFVFMGVLFMAGIFLAYTIGRATSINAAARGFGSVGFLLLYALLACLYFYPAYCLTKFSIGIKAALRTQDTFRFNNSLNYLKRFFIYIGILMILMLALYAFIVLGVGLMKLIVHH
jgi:hypothetical protein